VVEDVDDCVGVLWPGASGLMRSLSG